MSVSERDKKILMLLVPVIVVAAYWFLLFSPKREESAAIQSKLAQAETAKETAEAQAASVASAKQGFASDYTTVIRLGKAVPSNVDMPSLLMQLDRAARGTGIDFDKIATGERTAAPAAPAAQPQGGTGGAQPQSPAGQAQQTAQNGANQANNTGTLPAQNGSGSTPPPAGATPGKPPAGGTPAPGLESVPLDFTFKGTFFDLADFFHRMKRFVRVANDDIVVRGRLMTIDSFNWKAEPASWPNLTAEVHATVYLAPKAQGVNAGATPQGPGATPTTPAAGGAAPATPATPAPTPATTAPAATVK